MIQTATASLMRNINRSAILDTIRENSPIARSQIAKRLKLSLPTVMRVVDNLIEEDLVRNLDRHESSGGRPRSLLEFNGQAYVVVGVDLGGTKMLGMLADLSGRMQHEIYVPWKENGHGDSLERLCELIQSLLDAPRPSSQRIRGIGIGAPGVTLREEGVVTWAPSLGWRDLPLKDILMRRFNLPVFVENDVNLAALGEMGFGAGKGARNLVCIAIGTGIGAGVIVSGNLYRGHHQAAGEIGYMLPGVTFLDRRYDEFGALEVLASGSGIAERARNLLKQDNSCMSAVQVTAEDVFVAARNGETWARQVVAEVVDYLSLAIANVACLFDPEVVILGGGVAQSADLLIGPILHRLDGVVPYPPRLVASSLGRRAAVMGAIMLVLNATTDRTVVERFL